MKKLGEGGGEGCVQGRDQQDVEAFTALLTMLFTGAVGLRGSVSLCGVLEVKPHQETPPPQHFLSCFLAAAPEPTIQQALPSSSSSSHLHSEECAEKKAAT